MENSPKGEHRLFLQRILMSVICGSPEGNCRDPGPDLKRASKRPYHLNLRVTGLPSRREVRRLRQIWPGIKSLSSVRIELDVENVMNYYCFPVIAFLFAAEWDRQIRAATDDTREIVVRVDSGFYQAGIQNLTHAAIGRIVGFVDGLLETEPSLIMMHTQSAALTLL
jgi:hypothetical protein